MATSTSRTNNSIKNATFGLVAQLFTLIINFVSRTFFINYLGTEILGINGLYSNILSLLSLAELGFGNAIIYSLYHPVKENDHQRIAGLLNYYKRIYIGVTGVIATIGCILIPFLPYIVNAGIAQTDLIAYYILFLLNTIFSYVFVYKTAIINAQQKLYITKIVNTLIITVQFILQIIALVVSRSYALFLIIQIIFTILNNIICSNIANRMYPYIKEQHLLPAHEKKKLKKNVSSIFLYKACGIILNNTDNIFISVLVSTLAVGFYSNYYMVISALSNIIFIIFNAITASIGNLMLEKDHARQDKIFMQLNYICFIITGFCTLELLALLNDFITVWIGPEFHMDFNIVIIIIINFYIYNIQNPTWAFRDASGLFSDAKNDTIILSIANIILSFILGKVWGIAGILAATAISRILITGWHQPYLLYKKMLKRNHKNYFSKQLLYITILGILSIPVFAINNAVVISSLPAIIIKALATAIIICPLLILLTSRTEEFRELKRQCRNIIKKFMRKTYE